MTNREEVYCAIDSERDYQDSKDPNDPSFADLLTVGEFLTLFEIYLRKSQVQWAKDPKQLNSFLTLSTIRKLAVIAVNCMEQHGAPQREGFEK